MTVFRGTDRIRRATAVVKNRLRQVRSISLKGITIVRKKLLPKWSAWIRNYRSSIAITAVAAVGVVAVAIVGQQYVQAHMKDYYRVYVNGALVGEISSSAKVEQWMSAKAVALSRANTPVLQELDENQVEYLPERAYKWEPDDENTLAALADQVKTHPIGVEIKVDGKVVGVVRDRATADRLLDRIRDKYIPEDATLVQVSAKKPAGPLIKTLSFAASSDTAVAAASDEDEAVEPVPGDTLGHVVTSIAFANPVGLSHVTLESAQLSDLDTLYRKLAGESEDEEAKPLLGVQSIEEVTQVELIEAQTEYQNSSDLRKGTTKVARQAKNGSKQVTYKQIKLNGEVLEEEVIAEQVLQEPVDKLVLRGTKVIPGEGTGKFAWPVSGHRITSTMGKRWGTMHNGIDIIGRRNIMAADNGVVEQVVYSRSGLGNHVVINHKNGYKTVYGHMSSIKVKKGQVVEKGESIGIMGSTGHSTGTHLHFEIHLNGKLKNPLNYL